jgi:hypothetical protein
MDYNQDELARQRFAHEQMGNQLVPSPCLSQQWWVVLSDMEPKPQAIGTISALRRSCLGL